MNGLGVLALLGGLWLVFKFVAGPLFDWMNEPLTDYLDYAARERARHDLWLADYQARCIAGYLSGATPEAEEGQQP